MNEDKNKKRERTDDEKIPDVGIRLNSPERGYENSRPEKERGRFYKWLDNFWYHYKWHTIIVTFLVVVITVCTVQSFKTTKYDMKVLYAGSKQLEGQEIKDIEEIFTGLAPKKNEDESLALALNGYYILSEEQIKEGNKNYDANRNSNDYSNLQSYLQTGDASIMLLERWIYDGIPKESLCKLSEIYSENLPDGAIDGYGVKLGDTEIYKAYPALQKLPEDTIVCLQIPLYHEKKLKKSTQRLYEIEKSTFKAFLDYPISQS